jgi:hypothetical protein
MASVVLALSLHFSGVPAKCENVGRPTAVGPRAEGVSFELDVHEFMEWPAPPSGVVGSPANQEEEEMDISVLGIDLGKNVCSVVGLDASDPSLCSSTRTRATGKGNSRPRWRDLWRAYGPTC